MRSPYALGLFTLLIIVALILIVWSSYRYDTMIVGFSNSFKERDERLHNINTRLQTLEEQRDLERRVSNLEKAARVFCIDGKTAMCGTLNTVDK